LLSGARRAFEGYGWGRDADLLVKLNGWQNLTAIATFAGDLYVATSLNDGKLWRRQNGAWQSLALGVAEPIYSLQPTADRLYVVSDSGLRSFDGATFTQELSVQARGAGAVVATDTDVWVSGQGGRIFQKSAQGFDLVYGSDFPGVGTDALLAVRSENDIFWISRKTLHFDGREWQESPFPQPLSSQALFAGKTSLWATGNEELLRWNGADWVTQYTAPTYMHAIWAAENGEVWAAGVSAPVHFDGQAWSVVSTAPITQTVDALHGTAHDDVWAVAKSFIYHYDGNAWVRVVAPIVGTDWLTTVHAISPTSVWFGGSNGQYYHFDGNDFTRFDGAPGYWITSMAAISDTDVWAIETTQVPHGYVSHFDGTQWTAMDTGCAHPLNQIYVQDANTVWAAGRGALLRWKRP